MPERPHAPSRRPAHRDAPRAALAELLVTAAAELAAPLPPLPVPDGRPVTRGRVALGRYRDRVAPDGVCTVAVAFAAAAWLGPPGSNPLRRRAADAWRRTSDLAPSSSSASSTSRCRSRAYGAA